MIIPLSQRDAMSIVTAFPNAAPQRGEMIGRSHAARIHSAARRAFRPAGAEKHGWALSYKHGVPTGRALALSPAVSNGQKLICALPGGCAHKSIAFLPQKLYVSPSLAGLAGTK